MPINEILQPYADKLNIILDKTAIKRLEKYSYMLSEWNQKMNLTAITEPYAVAIKHFADSVTLLSAVTLPYGASVIDVGTGAGFPGAVLKIARPDLKITLLDSLQKRLSFLENLFEELELAADFVHQRAEDAAHQEQYREQFDLVTARAVAPLNILCELCMPFTKQDGMFAAMKGPGVQGEWMSAMMAVQELGGIQSGIVSFNLPDASERNIVLIKKISKTSEVYPRKLIKISKTPL